MSPKNLRNRSGFVSLKGMRSFKVGMGKGFDLSIEGERKRCLFRRKWYVKGKGLDLAVEPPQYKHLLSTNLLPPPPPPPPFSVNEEINTYNLFLSLRGWLLII